MWKKIACSFLSLGMTCSITIGHQSDVYAISDPPVNNISTKLVPMPQKVDIKNGSLQVSSRVNIIGEEAADQDALHILTEFLKANTIEINEEFDSKSTTIALGEEDKLNPELKGLEKQLGLPNDTELKAEGYTLAVNSEENEMSKGGTIFVKGKDGDGTFYGVKTLLQLAEKEDNTIEVNNVMITDEPSMSVRGIVEGFYGKPWSHNDRLDQIEFYGDYKLNTYIYAPKDDPYHREKWRVPYPENEMKRMEELITAAKSNKVDFVFALSPGIDIRFDGQSGEDDFQALLAKSESLYDMGVRSFAILFDDIGNKQGAKQANLLNRFNEEFIKTKTDVTPLITVPTEYDTHAMGEIGNLSTYTKAFSETLNKDVKVMWTGQAVVSEALPLENVEFMREVYGDRIGVWWNYPVSDYLRSKLALGPIVNIDNRLEGKLDFFTMNPMEHADLSKISLATGADYSWNTSNYDSDRSWNRSIELLFNDLAPEMKTFANHSSRMTGSWSIGRGDAVNVRKTMDQFWSKLSKRQDTTQEINLLTKEFVEMVQAANTLKEELPPEILSEALASLNKLKLLGENDQLALEMVLAKRNTETEKYNELKKKIEANLPALNGGNRVSEETALAFIKEALEYDPLPKVSFDVSKTFVAPGEEIKFQNTSSMTTEEIEWTFEGAKVEKSIEPNPTVVYEQEGLYTVKLVGKNPLGQDEVIKENVITVSNLANKDTTNLALGKSAAASSSCAPSERPQYAVDGKLNTKWCGNGSGTHQLTVDLGGMNLVSEIVMKHAEEGGEPSGSNTSAYRVLISEDGVNFKELVKVTGNKSGITKDQVPATKGRYVRLMVDKPTQGDDRAARIYEFEVMGLEGDVALPPKYEKPKVEKSILEKTAAEANEKIESDYTVKSWDLFVLALEKANEVLADEKATQDEVNAASENLAKAITGLVRKETFIETGINSIDEDIKTAYEQGLITNHGIVNSLLAKVDHIQKHQADKQKVIDGLHALGNQVKAQSGKKISQEYAEELLSIIEELKNEIAALK
ncbi:PKD domain-containing protein [Bacillus sp. S3]|uniref:beta-N-acetylglucosaminidase domain-containing protein n=1 Tax=Bacillus sp. S3 TaxID=486398 RepID=UPI00118986E7|nr:beta-N-acetylglucosaminidase domain-containing protein [Bacillus sp. S3]QCJ44459.1 PKD domain-containing protein [Bacillus sp. S3]